MEKLSLLWQGTGLANFSWGQALMIGVGLLLLYLAIRKGFELLLTPIGFGAILSNIPVAEISGEGGILHYLYYGIQTSVFPLLIFMGVGALTDFGPMLANPRTLLLGGAAQFGIFGTLLGTIALNLLPGLEFSLKDAAAIAIIGGADGPTSIYVASRLAPQLLGAIAVASYSYMAQVPLIQPPIMRLLTTAQEGRIEMPQLRPVSQKEKIIFPLMLILLTTLLLPSAAPLIGMFAFGNLLRECGVAEQLSRTSQNELKYRDHFPWAGGGFQTQCGRFPASGNAGNPGARGHRLCAQDRSRSADGQANDKEAQCQLKPQQAGHRTAHRTVFRKRQHDSSFLTKT